MEEHYTEAISLDELAKVCNLNAAYLNRIFKQALGLPPHAYQINVRLLKAKVLLQEGQTISNTALKLGFTDQSHFTRRFKRSFGMTPGQYQKINTKKSKTFKTSIK